MRQDSDLRIFSECRRGTSIPICGSADLRIYGSTDLRALRAYKTALAHDRLNLSNGDRSNRMGTGQISGCPKVVTGIDRKDQGQADRPCRCRRVQKVTEVIVGDRSIIWGTG